jgi:hypothetical protein
MTISFEEPEGSLSLKPAWGIFQAYSSNKIQENNKGAQNHDALYGPGKINEL